MSIYSIVLIAAIISLDMTEYLAARLQTGSVCPFGSHACILFHCMTECEVLTDIA